MFDNPLDLIQSIKNKRILLVGDTIIDKNTYGTLLGTSAETPTIVAERKSSNYSLGGAFLVARNLITLGAKVTFITLSGDDENTFLIDDMRDENLTTIIISDLKRPTTIKSRYCVDDYKLLQFDSVDNSAVDEHISEKIYTSIMENIDKNELLIFSDYRHGMLTSELISKSLELAKSSKKTSIVDSQISQIKSNHKDYKGANVFLLNKKEAQEVLGKSKFKPAKEVLQKIKKTLEADELIVKLGSEGCVGLIKNQFSVADSIDVDVVDTCGAGDAYLAAYSFVYSELDLESRLSFSNFWAGKSTETHGANPPIMSDL